MVDRGQAGGETQRLGRAAAKRARESFIQIASEHIAGADEASEDANTPVEHDLGSNDGLGCSNELLAALECGPSAKKTLSKTTKYGRYTQDITLEELQAHFVYPAAEAAKRMGLGLTVMKRLCRKFGVMRWPYSRSTRSFEEGGGVFEVHSNGGKSEDIRSMMTASMQQTMETGAAPKGAQGMKTMDNMCAVGGYGGTSGATRARERKAPLFADEMQPSGHAQPTANLPRMRNEVAPNLAEDADRKLLSQQDRLAIQSLAQQVEGLKQVMQMINSSLLAIMKDNLMQQTTSANVGPTLHATSVVPPADAPVSTTQVAPGQDFAEAVPTQNAGDLQTTKNPTLVGNNTDVDRNLEGNHGDSDGTKNGGAPHAKPSIESHHHMLLSLINGARELVELQAKSMDVVQLNNSGSLG